MNAHGIWFRFGIVLFVSCLIEVAGLAANYPLKIHPGNPHLLADQNNTPFLLHGDAAWGLMVMLDKAEAEQYLENRRAKGFNTLLVMLIARHIVINNRATANRYGQEPFTTLYDFTTPNPAYFEHVDWVIDRAAQKGIQVLLAPCYVGYYDLETWQDVMVTNGTNKCRAYGRYLGQRYKDKPNLIWLNYGDTSDPAALPFVRELALGILESDTNHLHTAKMYPQESARQFVSGESWFNLNTTYAYGDEWVWRRKVYDMSLQDYNATPVMASFLIESHYEGENTEEVPGGVPPHWVRRQAYWSVLSGSSGQIMGEHHIWPFLTGWQTAMDSASSVGEMFVRKLFDTRPWHAMVPDQNHGVITSGYGTFTNNNYLTAMRATNGSTVIAYMPSGRTAGVNMSKISGTQARAWWFNPRDGCATDLGTFATSGTNTFTPSDTNDWVLVLDDDSAGYLPPGSGPGTLEILTGSVPSGRAGVPYSVELLARGGTSPYVWSVATNSMLPPGLCLSSNGLLSGNPSNSGTFNITVQVTDSMPTTATQSLRLNFSERDTVAPTTPGALTAFAASCRQIDLIWCASTDNVATTSYLVERRGGTNACFTQIAATTGLLFRDTGLAAGTSYQYRVRAADETGNLSACSDALSIVTWLSSTVPAGLVAGYGFGEGAGTRVRDAADNANTGIITGATWTATGKFGSALTFNGTNSLVLVSNAPSLNLTTGMTLEAWVYPTASQTGWRTIVQRETDAYLLHAGNDKSALRPTGGGTFNGTNAWTNATTALSLNTWTHLALTYDSTTLRLHVNGTPSASRTVSGTIQTNANPLRIGGNSPYGEFFIGRIDEVRVYNRPLSQTEIQADMITPVEATVTNTAPTISTLANQVIDENTAAGPLELTVMDTGQTADNLTLLGTSSNPTLVPACNIGFAGSGTNRAVTITPTADQSGTATIMLSVSDGEYVVSSFFDLTVNPVVHPPATNAINIISVELTGAGQIRLTGTGDANVTYKIQASADLVEWLDVGEAVTNEFGAFEFVDEEPADLTARFYRVMRR